MNTNKLESKKSTATRCSLVAQASNLLYRRASSLRAVRTISRARRFGRSADWKSAIQQVGNLRYAKLVALCQWPHSPCPPCPAVPLRRLLSYPRPLQYEHSKHRDRIGSQANAIFLDQFR